MPRALLALLLLCPTLSFAQLAVEMSPGVTLYNGDTYGIELSPGVTQFSGAVNGLTIQIAPGITQYNLQSRPRQSFQEFADELLQSAVRDFDSQRQVDRQRELERRLSETERELHYLREQRR